MSTPETKNILVTKRVAEDLWQKASTSTLGPDDPILQNGLHTIDELTQHLFERAFAKTFGEKSFLIKDSVTAKTEGYQYRIGYNNDEANAGLRFLRASWDNGSWVLEIDTYHLAGYHRLHQVTIVHGDKQVTFLYPERFVGKTVPANTLPTDIVVKNLRS